MFWVQLFILSVVILGGIRLKVGFGLLGYLGLATLTFVFHVQPKNPPPFDVLVIVAILATVVGSTAAAGGLDYLAQVATRLLKKYPNQITFLSPLVSYLVVFLSGNQHVMHLILPSIAKISQEVGVSLERSLSTSVTAALQAQLASPISLSMAFMVCCLSPSGLVMADIVKVLLLSTLGSVVCSILLGDKLVSLLSHIPFTLGGSNPKMEDSPQKVMNESIQQVAGVKAKTSFILLVIGGIVIIGLNSFNSLRSSWQMNSEAPFLSLPIIVFVLIMLSISALTVLLCDVNPSKIIRQNIAQEHFQTLINLSGSIWLIDTLLQSNEAYVITLIQASTYPAWGFGIILLFTSLITKSSLVAMHSIVPLSIMGGVLPTTVLASLVAANGVLIEPSTPTLQTATQLVRSMKTTRSSKFLLYSFTTFRLISTIITLLIAFYITKLLSIK